MEPKILIISQSHLCRNPRVLKEAIALSLEGYKVSILNAVFSDELCRQDMQLTKSYPNISVLPVVDLSIKSLKSYFDRVAFKAGTLMTSCFGIDNVFALGYAPLRYLRKSRQLNADLVICHQEVATWVGTQLLGKGYQVAFDFEDWYSADLLPAARKKRPIKLLERVEGIALQSGRYCTTTSLSLAGKLAEVYSCQRPSVIYNVFPVADLSMKRDEDFKHPLKLFWCSQTVGPGRGIEKFIYWLQSLKSNIELHLLGQISQAYKEELCALMPPRYGLYFHPLVDDKDLANKISNFDVGLALELSEPESRNYTITNKFFQYLEAGLPVIATETAGQKEIFDAFTPGIMLPQNALAEDLRLLENWLNSREKIAHARAEAKRCAAFYSWDKESTKLLSLINNAYGSKS